MASWKDERSMRRWESGRYSWMVSVVEQPDESLQPRDLARKRTDSWCIRPDAAKACE